MGFDISDRNERVAGGFGAEMGILGTKSANYEILLFRFGALVVLLAQRHNYWYFEIACNPLKPKARLEIFCM